jgi:hypothetical protein
MLKAVKWVGVAMLLLSLTALTQIGGLVLVLAWLVVRAISRHIQLAPSARRAGIAATFIILHLVATLYIVPPLAAFTGREALQCYPQLDRPYGALSSVYCYLGRNYVRREALLVLDALAEKMATKFPGTVVAYLDASFPFIDGFPLPPHVTHNDGLRIDLAYFYLDAAGSYLPMTTPSPIGYWGFERPAAGESDVCRDKPRWLTLRWDMSWFQAFVRRDLVLDPARTETMLQWLADEGLSYGVRRVLLEPHMVNRFGIARPFVRFQGCRAGRHDDHVHVDVGKDLGLPDLAGRPTLRPE